MNSTIKLTAVTLASVAALGVASVTNSASADSSAGVTSYPASSIVNVSSDVQNKVEPFVTTDGNNQYILSADAKTIGISDDDYQKVNQAIQNTNQAIQNNGYEIDSEAKTAEPVSLFRSYGKNDVKFHWNYATIYLNRTQAQAISSAAITGGSGAAGAALSAIPSLGIGSEAGGIAGAAIGSYLSTVVSNDIDDGVWVNYNFFTHQVTGFGWQ